MPQEAVSLVQEQLNKLVALFPEKKIAFRILSSAQVKGRVSDQAHYVAAYTRHGLEEYTNLGFMLEQLVLWLTAQGIATWWHGLINPIPEFEKADGRPFAFMFTFGVSDGDAVRNEGDFDRKPLDQITDVSGVDALLEAVRLAPSGRNVQPWFFSGDSHELKLYKEKENPIIAKLAPDVGYIDGGIALAHLWLAAHQAGREVSFKREAGEPARNKKSEYICTVHI